MATTAADCAPQLTSTTAPGRAFSSRQELAEHYKSDWHKYNLKRREAGLPLLLECDFQARLAAAQSLRRSEENARDGTDHLKRGKKPKNNNNKNKKKEEMAKSGNNDDDDKIQVETVPEPVTRGIEDDEDPVIDPKQCLFDRHFSATVEANADRMYRKYGLFLPDREYLSDLEGLIGFCHEKIKLGHMCLYCHKVFPSWQGCQKHMISKLHTKLRYEAGIDLEDLSVFYDFSEADNEFLRSIKTKNKSTVEDMEEDVDNEDGADVSDNDAEMVEGPEGDDDEEDFDEEYDQQLAQFGFDVTDLGELILPNGRVIGHRALARYYRQRARPLNTSTAVVAARRAAGERLLDGQVINVHGMEEENTLALSKAGIAPGMAAGRAGNGILVKGSGGVYTSLSIYRYRAVMRKQRREDKQGSRLYDRAKMNMNRMDKKANRLMNGVSVAHAAR